MSEILKVKSIGDYHAWLGTEPIHPLVSIVDYSQIKPGIPARKLYGFYAVFLKGGHCGELRYGRQNYDYQDGTLLFVAPGQTYGSDNVTSPIQGSGYALLFHPDLLRGTHFAKRIREYTFFSYAANEALHLSDNERKTVMACLDRIRCELQNPEDKHSRQLIVDGIQMFLDYCARYYARQFATRAKANKDLLARLETLLDGYFNSGKALSNGLPTVKACANALNLSPNYLSDLLRKETGDSALSYIHTKLIEQAKMELTSTDKTINEIAYGLGFEYAPHFVRLFKKCEGCTPGEYRRQVL